MKQEFGLFSVLFLRYSTAERMHTNVASTRKSQKETEEEESEGVPAHEITS